MNQIVGTTDLLSVNFFLIIISNEFKFPQFVCSWIIFEIPEYCRSNDEKEMQANLFDLIFAFDEIVALGYRENVNLAQIRTFTEMDSHEERVFNQIKIVSFFEGSRFISIKLGYGNNSYSYHSFFLQAQERAANELMTQKAMELKKLKAEQRKSGRGICSFANHILFFAQIVLNT